MINSFFKNSVLVVFIICNPLSFIIAQTSRIDSLRFAILKSTSDNDKKTLALAMCDQHYSMPVDSLLHYINVVKNFSIAGSIDNYRAQYFYNIYLLKTGKAKEAIDLCDSLLEKIKSSETYDKVRLEIMAGKCAALIRNDQSKQAIEQSFKLLESAEALKDSFSIVKAYIYLGWANMELSQNTEAIKWLQYGYHLSSNPEILKLSGSLFSNMASCYNNIEQLDSAFFFIALALKYNKQAENLSGLANALNIRSDMFLKKKKYDAAENDLKEALQIRKQIGDIIYVISDLGQLAYFYASTNQTEKGIQSAQEGITLAQKTKNISKLIFLYYSLSENYKTTGNYNDYASSLLKIIDLKDSLYKKNSADAIADFEAKYELQKKENLINKQHYEIVKNRYFNIGFSLFAVLSLLLIFFIYRNIQQRQKNTMIAAVEEQKLLSFKAVKEAEENERKRIAADLHDNLGTYAAAITSNVKHLKEQPQTSNVLANQLEENAQSMVTQLSDTIWVLKHEKLLLTQLADRFKIWLQRVMKNYPDVTYYYNEDIENDVAFNPEKILHLFLILKECITNALKHSDCKNLKIQFSANNEIKIVIEDDGTGMNDFEPGNGIANIKQRASMSGCTVSWVNNSPSGTLVNIYGTTTI